MTTILKINPLNHSILFNFKMTDLNLTKSVMIEVEQLYSRDDDLKDIQDVRKMAKEIDQFYTANLKDAKEIIKRASFSIVFYSTRNNWSLHMVVPLYCQLYSQSWLARFQLRSRRSLHHQRLE